MPELPETETIARDLEAAIGGGQRRIVGAEVTRPDVLRGVNAAGLARRTRGATIVRCWRRAKLVVLDLSSGDRIVVQPRFTGALLLDAGDLDERERRYSTLAFALDDGRRLHYRDIRRLGTVALLDPPAFAAYEATLGVEPLGPDFSPSRLSGILRASGQAVKKVLMDQRRVVGIGNIYANEALWRAGIHPARRARQVTAAEAARLHEGIVSVLRESIAERGTSFRDYRDASGNRGGFVERLAAYGRGGLPCPRCGTLLLATHDVDGRSSVLCPGCQS
ncbi:MAG TPA: bifunctional DNA-formamidopyrimidine glycosylase/DNA-(apurinic or apyrimidinic site) lyase [Gemmatimonadaceae bacterium]|nr:bifunctional DNA-formamidopyrimidine glycosylase/DNA-(apurinic or apyrimidinic site) lyase [Gemmatimonadaceae bacterium]